MAVNGKWPTTGSQTINDYPDHPRVAVGGVVFHDGRVLLVRRAKAPAQGQWAIPGGSVNLGESLAVATEREVFEETGITIRAGEPMFTFDAIHRDEAGRVRFHYVIVDLMGEYLDGEPVAGDDAAEARWVAPADLAALPVSEPTRRLLRDRLGFGG